MSGFHVRLKAERQRLGLTQEALAEELNVTKASVSAWENGREKPGFRLLPKLRTVLGVPLDELICGEGLGVEPLEPPSVAARNEAEAALLLAYRRLSVKRRKGLLDLLS
ncbi:transcriptional regulator [Alcanivorax sp. N3-2A]|nr:transcriptional regulator [Alcanivorax sp. N3-2A]